MSKIYAVASQKGGVAKTTTAINMGVEMARQGYKTLLVDCDAQGSLTASLGYQQPDSIEDTLASVMEMEVNDVNYDAENFGILHHREGVDVMPSNIELSGLEVSLVGVWSREMILSRYLDKVKDRALTYIKLSAYCFNSISICVRIIIHYNCKL